MSINFSNVEKVMYGAQEVIKIQQGSTVLWEKAVDPTANLLSFSGSGQYSYNSGNTNAIGKNVSQLDSASSIKIYWQFDSYGSYVDSNEKLIFPYKTSSSGSTLSKFGLGTCNGRTSDNKMSTGTARYGIELKDGFDMSSYKHSYEYGTLYAGEFTVTPASSSTYNKVCAALLQLENLYGTDGSGQKTASVVIYNGYSGAYFWMNGQAVWVGDDNKVLMARLTVGSEEYMFWMCVEVIS